MKNRNASQILGLTKYQLHVRTASLYCKKLEIWPVACQAIGTLLALVHKVEKSGKPHESFLHGSESSHKKVALKLHPSNKVQIKSKPGLADKNQSIIISASSWGKTVQSFETVENDIDVHKNMSLKPSSNTPWTDKDDTIVINFQNAARLFRHHT